MKLVFVFLVILPCCSYSMQEGQVKEPPLTFWNMVSPDVKSLIKNIFAKKKNTEKLRVYKAKKSPRHKNDDSSQDSLEEMRALMEPCRI